MTWPARAAAVWGVAALWLTSGFAAAAGAGADESIHDRLQRIVIPRISCRNAPVRSVVDSLKKLAKEADELGEGVNIVYLPDGEAGKSRSDGAGQTITMELDSVPVGEVIRYLCLGAGLQYRVENHAVTISRPAKHAPEPMRMKFYPIPSAFFFKNGGKNNDDVKDFFEEMGVGFPPAARISYHRRTGKLAVHNTEENLRKLERILVGLFE